MDELRISDVCRYGESPSKDASGNGNLAYLRGDARVVEGGRYGNAVAVSGSADSRLEIHDHPNGSLELSGDFTLEAWVYADPEAEGPVSGTVFEKSDGEESFSYRLWLEDGTLKFSSSADGLTSSATSFAGDLTGVDANDVQSRGSNYTPKVKPRRWTRVAATREDGILKLWVADESVGEYAHAAGVFDGAGPLTIGQYFRGRLDELRLSSISREGQFGVVEERYTYNPRNQLTTRRIGSPGELDDPVGALLVTTERHAYDANGSLTRTDDYPTATAESPLASAFHEYDELARNTAYRDDHDEYTVRYRGAEWHRWAMTTPTGTMRWHYDDLTDNRIAQQTGQRGNRPTLSEHYLAPFLDQQLAAYTPNAPLATNTRYYAHDALGSVRLTLSPNGTPTAPRDHTAFGHPFATINNAPHFNQPGYTGRHGLHVGAYDYRYRGYLTNSGRFFARDPAGYDENELLNVYDYVLSRPALFIDPYGLNPIGNIGRWIQGCINPAVDHCIKTLNTALAGCNKILDQCDREECIENAWKKYHKCNSNMWGQFWSGGSKGLSQATYGTLNTIAGGLIDPQCGFFYNRFNNSSIDTWGEPLLDNTSFNQGSAGAATGLTVLGAAGSLGGAGVNPWLGAIAKHPAHHGHGPHLQIMIRMGARRTGHLRIPVGRR